MSILLPVNVSEIVLDEWQSSVESDQMPYSVGFDLGLHCLLRSVCPNTLNYYGKNILISRAVHKRE